MIARGYVCRVAGGLLFARMPRVRVGQSVRIGEYESSAPLRRPHLGKIEAFDGNLAVIASFGSLDGISEGARVSTDPSADELPLGMCALGRAIDACGAPLDGGKFLMGRAAKVSGIAISPEKRVVSRGIAWTGIRAIDGLLSIAHGARVGIFGAPGVGKSTLLDSIVHGIHADVTVVGLIGERGREAEQWIRQCMPSMTIVCATSDSSAAERVRAADVAFAHAHVLRARGLNVVVLLDSLARYAYALRELAIATGEPVGRGGYPPSVFSRLAKTLEIAGTVRCSRRDAKAFRTGSMTLIATVLDDGDERDPVSDAARSLLDGHIQLSPKLARSGHFPAIDIPASTSRTMGVVAELTHQKNARIVRDAIAWLDRTEDARSIGIVPLDAQAGRILDAQPHIRAFLCQPAERSMPAQTLVRLAELTSRLEEQP